ncbi:MAG: tRNA threonylcarbamoyladenosine dehydratase [Clostridia bacterium]|nr:tRNA threonylcarbamoyladenosine dehydratase [Clostridia bacterium]
MSDFDLRHERTKAMIGSDALQKLKDAHVTVFGVGGVGCYCIEALARAGIGSLTLIDGDVFSVSNLNRQLYSLKSNIGCFKAEEAKKRIFEIDESIKVRAVNEFAAPENVPELLTPHPDFVVDAIDDVKAKLAIAKFCFDNGIQEVSSMGTGNKLLYKNFEIADISKTEYDPLAKAMRKKLRDMGVKKLKVCFSRETLVTEPVAGIIPSISFVPAIGGLTIAGEVIRCITKREAPK